MKQYFAQKKNHSQQKSGPALSETFSSDVTHSIWGSPTDTHPALNESDTKVQNNSLSTKNNIKKYHNNDFKVNYNGSYEQIRVDLRRLLSLKKSGVSDYTIYITPKGRLAFRLTNHNANGNNFSQDNANQNISVYVAYQEFIVPPSLIPYTEYRIAKETFEADKQKCIEEIVKAVENALNTGDFYMSEDVATKKTYPEDSSEDKHENSNYNNRTMKNNNKALYESIMKDVAKTVKRHLNEKFDHRNFEMSEYEDVVSHIKKSIPKGTEMYDYTLDLMGECETLRKYILRTLTERDSLYDNFMRAFALLYPYIAETCDKINPNTELYSGGWDESYFD